MSEARAFSSSPPSVPLVARSNYLRQRAREYRELEKLSRQRRQFEEQRDKLIEHRHTIEMLQTVRQHLSSAEVPLQPTMAPGTLGGDLRTFAEALRDNRAMLIDPGRARERKELIKRLEAIEADWNTKTKADWGEYVRGLMPQIAKNSLDAFSAIGDLSELVEAIRKEQRAVEDMAGCLPVSETEISRAKILANRVAELWGRLCTRIGSDSEIGDSAEIQRFLTAVREGGAPLDLLTTEVLGWLEMSGLAGAFLVVQLG